MAALSDPLDLPSGVRLPRFVAEALDDRISLEPRRGVA